MSEHVPPNALVLALAALVFAMSVWALGFWLLSLLMGVSGAIAWMGLSATAIFATLHIPAAIAGILLLQWHRPRLRRHQRIMLEAATLYFGLSVLIGIFFNYLAASLVDELI